MADPAAPRQGAWSSPILWRDRLPPNPPPQFGCETLALTPDECAALAKRFDRSDNPRLRPFWGLPPSRAAPAPKLGDHTDIGADHPPRGRIGIP